MDADADSLDIPLPVEERQHLRELARRYAEAAGSDENRRRIAAWTAHNDLRPGTPLMLLFPEGGWVEIEAAQPLRCRHEAGRRLERRLFQSLHTWERYASDNPLDPVLPVEMAVGHDGWGLDINWRHSDVSRGAKGFAPVVTSRDDYDRIRTPRLHHDAEQSTRRLAWHQELIGDLLPLRLRSNGNISFHLFREITNWRGLEQTFIDMIEDPDGLHHGLRRLTDAQHGLIRQYQDLDLWQGNNDNSYQSSGGNGWSAELPASRAGGLRPEDLWASSESQELSSVSPAMHREFALSYEKELLAPFARAGYGCCEPLHAKLGDVLADLPNLRRVSISPWADVAVSARHLAGRRAIFSWKPQPAHLAADTFDTDRIAAEIDCTLAACREHDCALEIILKDTHTCAHQPERFEQWARLCRERIRVAEESRQG